MANQLTITQSSEGSHQVLELAGEIDLATAPDFEEKVESFGGAGRLIIDMSRVTFMDSTGLRVLIGAHERATEAGGELAIVAAEGPVTRLLALTGVDEWLNVHESRTSVTADD